jgi:hypothetical protein
VRHLWRKPPGDNRIDSICPSFATGGCTNDVRIRRDDLHDEIFKHLRAHPFTDRAIASARKVLACGLRDLELEEAAASTTPAIDKALRKPDQQVEDLKDMNLPEAAQEAALTQLALQREALMKGGIHRVRNGESSAHGSLWSACPRSSRGTTRPSNGASRRSLIPQPLHKHGRRFGR